MSFAFYILRQFAKAAFGVLLITVLFTNCFTSLYLYKKVSMQKIEHGLENGLGMSFSVWIMKIVELFDYRTYSDPASSVHSHQHRCILSFQGPTPRIILLSVM